MSLIDGVLVPLITPYHLEEMPSVIDHVLAGGVKAVVLLGTTGEAPWMSFERKKALIQQIVPYIGNRAQTLVGITGKTLKETLHLADLASKMGAFASFLAPRVLGPDCQTIIEKVLSSSSNPLLLYNYPALSGGNHLPIKHIEPFFSEPRVLGIKDSSGDFAYFDELLKRRPSRFKVYFGPETNLEKALQKPINGFVPGTGNLEPHLACALWQEKEHGPWTQWNAIKAAVQAKDPDFITAFKLLLQERSLLSDPRRFS